MVDISEFREEIQLGDCVSLTYVYNQNRYTVEGVVIKLSDLSVRVQNQDGTTSRVELADLEGYRSIPPQGMVSIHQIVQRTVETKQEVIQPKTVVTTAVQNTVPVQTLLPMMPVMVPHQMQALQNRFLNAEAMDSEKIANIEGICDRLKDTYYPHSIRNGTTSILSAFSNIRRQANMPAAELKDKMHNITAKTLLLAKEIPDAEEDLYALLGGMNLLVKYYGEAERYFLKAFDYVGAAYAAHYGRNQRGLAAALDGYISSPETIDEYLYRLYASSASDRKDLRAMNDRKNELEKKLAFEPHEYDEMECLCACALSIAQTNNLPVQWVVNYEQSCALNCLEEFMHSVPAGWQMGMLINKGEKKTVATSERLVSTIKAFAAKNVPFGHIARTGSESWNGDTFFFIEQVNKDDLLREIMNYKNQALNLEVSYLLGDNGRDPSKPAAYDVRLTPRGAAEAARRLNTLKKPKSTEPERLSGRLREFEVWTGFGLLWVGSESYGVVMREIIDPHLRGYLCINHNGDYDIPVTFLPGKDNKGKPVARRIECEQNSCRLTEDEISDAIHLSRTYNVKLSKIDFGNWAMRSTSKVNDEKKMMADEDYRQRPYIPLIPWKGSGNPINKPVEDRNTTQAAETPVAVREKTTEVLLPPLEPLTFIRNGRFINLPSISGTYYDQAHRSMRNKQLKVAEELYIKAIQAEDKIESAILDLTALFLQDTSRVGDAIELLECYGSCLPVEKRLNCEISVYSKWKERPYRIKLCHLIENALQTPLKINTKLHYLNMQAMSLIAIEEYPMALNSYKRWRQAYDTEVQYRGQSAVVQFNVALNAVRRGEAICYYHSGDRSSAERLAKELLRVSSSDETAMQILDGTLIRSGQDTIVSEDENKISGAQVSDFAQARMAAIKLGEHLRNQKIGDGEYEGDARTAASDIKFLLEAKGKTPTKRSELNMCAAKIIGSILNRTDNKYKKNYLEEKGLTEQKQKAYIARSMASFGDAILDAQLDQDTARFAYLQAIEVLPDHEEDWKKSFNHYLWSYFHGQRDMSQRIRDDLNVFNFKIDLSILQKRPLDAREFLVGIVLLQNALRSSTRLRGQLVEQIRNSSLIDDVAEVLNKNGISAECRTADTFNKTLNSASQELTGVYLELAALLKRLPEQISARISGENLYSYLSDPSFEAWLCKSDLDRLNRIRQILSDFRQYFTFREFQHRASTIDTAIQRLIKLSDEVIQYPTKFSYEEMLPVLESTRTKLQEMLEYQYEKLPPDMEIAETENSPPYRGNNNEVYVHLTISNGNVQSNGVERQMADNVTLEVKRLSPGVLLMNIDLDQAGCVPGGKDIEAIMTFRITDAQILTMGMFDLCVECSYRYNVRPNEVTNVKIEFDNQVVFDADHQDAINNPYGKYVGEEMDDPEMFVGRDALIKELVESMRVDGRFNYGHGVLLYGQTRSGKSSIRLHFIKKVREKEPNAIVVDMGNLYSSGLSMASFYIRLLDKFAVEVENHHPEFAQLLAGRGLSSPSEKLLVMQDHAQMLFDRYLDRVQDLVLQEKKMILLVADEFSAIREAIKAQTIPPTFMQTFKAMLESYKIFAVCFGQDDTPEFVEMDQNGFGRLALKKVSYLEENHAKKLMEKPIMMENGDSRYSPAALDELYELTAGSAFLIVKVCDLLVQYLNSKGARKVTPGILRNFLNVSVFRGNECLSKADFEPQINDRAAPDKAWVNEKLLLDIARKSQVNGWVERYSLSDTYTDNRGADVRVYRTDELLKRLLDRDVLEQEDGYKYRIRVSLLSQWLLNFYGKE